jgi:hypothetical protein
MNQSRYVFISKLLCPQIIEAIKITKAQQIHSSISLNFSRVIFQVIYFRQKIAVSIRKEILNLFEESNFLVFAIFAI